MDPTNSFLQMMTHPYVYILMVGLFTYYFLYLHQHISRERHILILRLLWYSFIRFVVVTNAVCITITLAVFLLRTLPLMRFQVMTANSYAYIFEKVFPKAYWCSSTGNKTEDCNDTTIAHMIHMSASELHDRPQIRFVRFAVDDRLEYIDPTNGQFRSYETDSAFDERLREALRTGNTMVVNSIPIRDYFSPPCYGYVYNNRCDDGLRRGVMIIRGAGNKVLGAMEWFEGGGDNLGSIAMAPWIGIMLMSGVLFSITTLFTNPYSILNMTGGIDAMSLVFIIAIILEWGLIIGSFVQLALLYIRKRSRFDVVQ